MQQAIMASIKSRLAKLNNDLIGSSIAAQAINSSLNASHESMIPDADKFLSRNTTLSMRSQALQASDAFHLQKQLLKNDQDSGKQLERLSTSVAQNLCQSAEASET